MIPRVPKFGNVLASNVSSEVSKSPCIGRGRAVISYVARVLNVACCSGSKYIGKILPTGSKYEPCRRLLSEPPITWDENRADSRMKGVALILLYNVCSIERNKHKTMLLSTSILSTYPELLLPVSTPRSPRCCHCCFTVYYPGNSHRLRYHTSPFEYSSSGSIFSQSTSQYYGLAVSIFC